MFMFLLRSLSADSLCGESKQRTCHLILTTLLATRSSRLPPWDLVGLMLGNRCKLLNSYRMQKMQQGMLQQLHGPQLGRHWRFLLDKPIGTFPRRNSVNVPPPVKQLLLRLRLRLLPTGCGLRRRGEPLGLRLRQRLRLRLRLRLRSQRQ